MFEAIVAPEELVADDEARRAEDAEANAPPRSGGAGAPCSPACADSRTGRRRPERLEDVADDRGVAMSRSSAKLARVDPPRRTPRATARLRRAHATRAASRPLRGNRDGRRSARPSARAKALHVAPHVAALHGIEVERRIVPALGLKDRPEQERPPVDRDPGAHRRRARRATPRRRSRCSRTRTRSRDTASTACDT